MRHSELHIESDDSEERNNFRSDTGFFHIYINCAAVWGWMKMKWICFAHTRIAVLIAYCWRQRQQQQQFHDDDYTPSHIYLKFKWVWQDGMWERIVTFIKLIWCTLEWIKKIF